MMGSCYQIPLLLLVFFLLILASASALISDAVVGHQVVNGRRLLQIKTPCTVNIENLNYTIITSQCKGPDYPPQPCCSSLKEVACPIADQINDLRSNCADRLFSYITTVGQYPPGLFASICREGKEGLDCPASPPSPTTPNAAATPILLGRRIFIALLLFPLQFVV